jgi:hypothetical protein
MGEIEIVEPPAGAHASSPLGINDRGDVVGFFEDDDGIHGYLRTSSGRFQVLDFPGATFTVPLKVSGDGRVAGYYVDDAERVSGFVATPE